VRAKAVLYYAGVAAAVAAALVVTLRLWERRPEVPFGYEGDAVFFAVVAKAAAEDGPLHFRHLGMPFGVAFADWGAGMPLDLTALRVLVAALGEPGTAVNTWWLLSVVATGVLAAFAFRALDLGPVLGFGLGSLYALSPFAFYRNVGHLSLVYHFVPLVALLAVRTAEGRPEKLSRAARATVLLGCGAQGLSYIYYSFFSCLLLGTACVLGWLKTRRVATVKLAAAGLLLVLAGTAVGLAPSLLYWHANGRSPELQYKLVLESDLFALKVRHLLIPIPDHPLAPFRALARAAVDAGFPGENENTMARLGTLGSLGFLGLLGYSVAAAGGLVRGERGRLGAAAALTLVAVLVAQVGGFGSLFSLLVSHEIRAYNRIVVFIAFFALLAAGLGLERLRATSLAQARPVLIRAGVLLLLLAAVFDQASATGLRLGHDENARRFDRDRAFVVELETRLPREAMVYQLPYTAFPFERGQTRMAAYDHGHAYMHSRSLRWSWGAMGGRNGNWQAEVQNLGPRALVRTLALAGFSGIWIDRFGYEPPPGHDPADAPLRPSPEAGVVRAAGEEAVTSEDGRHAFVPLESARRRLVAELGPEGFASAADTALRAPLVPRYREGFGEEDGDGARVWRPGSPRARIVIMNPVDREREVLLTAQLLPTGAGKETIEISSPQFTEAVTAVPGGAAFRRTAFLPARRRLQIHFSCPDRPPSGEEPCFRLLDFQVTDAGPTPELDAPSGKPADEGQ
jgi:phosphoglycerol transferase